MRWIPVRLASIGPEYLPLTRRALSHHSKLYSHQESRLRTMAALESPTGHPQGTTPEPQETSYTFIDIGSNLGDPVFRGEYHGKQVHADDFQQILTRARSAGVVKQILTGDCLSGSKEVREMARGNEELYATVGCHPCRANEFEASAQTDSPADVERSAKKYLEALDQLIAEDQASGHSRVVAVGECGLDYDRLSHASKETQLRYFPPQLELATKYNLPLFLHSRTSEAHVDFVRIIRAHEARYTAEELLPARKKGVVHSFTGTIEEMKELVDLGFSIGINGCSLKTEENLEVVKAVPLDRIMLETDCPWCEIRPSHASHRYLSELPLKPVFSPATIKKERHQVQDEKMVKGRNEPCTIGQVAWVVSKLKGIPLSELTQSAWKNSVEMFTLL
ncbi:hypothetical protein PtA15_5A815 [Puccinia triticina]|uniref:TatD DNase n=1 Tax=Puccinia triticina TaxID=208348 RepID=A0ABY7CM90_9BASI|nr:uncharacterized protein PtA15_5A815 [Puccinia triticina]WAQ85241.1 hypothetical protein PtA15_5A815 [Puccinia triticina]